MKRLSLIIATFSMLTACVGITKVDEKAISAPGQAILTISEARAYFETGHGLHSASKAGGTNVLAGIISPGDFTPLWDNAVESAKGNTASVDVPIIPTYRYRAIRSEFTNGCAKAYSVDIYQKLIIVKKYDNSVVDAPIGQYILTLIPDKEYASRHRGHVVERFVNAGSKNGYSGLAVYFLNGIPVRLNKYVEGSKTKGISVFGETDIETLKLKYGEIFKELEGISIIRSSAVRTRMGEGGEEWEFRDIDDYYDLGNGYYQDEDGDYFIDIDGDGKIDTIYIRPFDPEISDSPDPWDGDGEDDIWPPVADEDLGNYNDGDGGDDGYFEDEYDDWTPVESTPDNQLDKKTPALLLECQGKASYYTERVKDFYKRYPYSTAPAYYLNYGFTYCNLFMNKTKPLLSPAGQDWIDRTVVSLQEKLTAILIKNPDIELNPKELEKKHSNHM